MRKIFFLICMAVYFLVGCGKDSDTLQEKEISDKKEFLFMTNDAESDDGVYYVEWSREKTRDTLFFVDKKTAKKTVLCRKVNCSHDSDECQAVSGEDETMGCAVYSDGMVYFMIYARYPEPALKLYSMKEDGTEKRLEHTFENVAMYPNVGGMYHGKIFLSVATMQEYEEGNSMSSAEPTIVMYDLETQEEEILIDGFENEGQYVVPCGGIGEYVYFAQMPFDGNGMENGLAFREYNLETKEWLDIYETAMSNYQVILDDYLYVQSKGEKQIEKYNWKTKESSVVLEWKEDVDRIDIGVGYIQFTKESEEDGIFKQYCNWYDLSEGEYLFEEYQDTDKVSIKCKMGDTYWGQKEGELYFYHLDDKKWEKIEDIR